MKLTLLLGLFLAVSCAHKHSAGDDPHYDHKSHAHHKHHHEHKKNHKHKHSKKCKHLAVKHDDHVDYKHGNEWHHQVDGHTHVCEGPKKS